MRLLLNPGDNCLFEEFTFPAPVENARAMGVGLVPVPLDAEGISPTAVDVLLTNWSTENFGPKPRVLYTITVGQNPTGSTPGLERLQAIYAVAQKHDLILIEDDPYAFVQLGPYARGRSSAIRKADSGYSSMVATPVDGLTGRPSVDNSLVSFKHTLSRSLLSLDVDGRVIRTDSFSKVRRITRSVVLCLMLLSGYLSWLALRDDHSQLSLPGTLRAHYRSYDPERQRLRPSVLCRAFHSTNRKQRHMGHDRPCRLDQQSAAGVHL